MSDIYKVDKAELAVQQEERALVALVEVEKNTTAQSNVVFLNNNFLFKKIRDRKTEIDFRVMLAISLTKICALAGIKEKVSSVDSDDILRMIYTAHSDLTLEEIYKAFELERYSVYEDKTQHFQLFNAEYVSAILKKYKNWKALLRKEHNILPPPLPKKTGETEVVDEVSDEMKVKIMDDAIANKYLEYLTTNDISEPITHIFDELVDRKLIELASPETPELLEYYNGHMEQAKNDLLAEYENVEGRSFTESRSIVELVKEIKSGKSSKIYLLVKKRVILDYFQKRKEENEKKA